MKTANLANEALRYADVGHVWEEVLTAAIGTFEVLPHQTFRVRAGAGTTVTIDGVLAMTMAANEVAIFCAGNGDPADAKPTVTIAIAVAVAYVQVARELDRKV